MDRADKRRRCLDAVDEDLRPYLTILFDRAGLLERQGAEGDWVGFYDDVLDLTWRHLGRPGERNVEHYPAAKQRLHEAAPKPYDRPPDETPKGEQDRRRP